MQDGQPEIFDWTKLSAYKDCMRKGHLGFEDTPEYGDGAGHLVPAEPNEALAFGIGIHKMAEVWTAQAIAIQTGNVSNEIAMEHAKAAFLAVWERELPLELREKLELEGNRRSYASACRLFEAYTRKFPLEMYDKIVALETPFTLYLGRTPVGREISWSGILDRAVQWQGGIYYVDIKTSSYSIDDKFFSQFRYTGQMVGYCWAGQELDLGQFAGIMVQGIEVKAPPKTAKGRTVEELIGVDIIPILPEHIGEWKQMVLHKIDEIYAAREAKYWEPAMGHACNVYGVGCQFKSICYSHPDIRAKSVQDHYRRRVWNPLDRA